MADERWPHVKALFQSAATRPAGERDAFLAAATGDDEALRREVESLLTWDSADGSVLDRPHPTSADHTQSHGVLAPGDRLGPYQIGGQLGVGAMGEVYRARDTNLNRDVALKVLPELFALDPDRLARFKREAQVLATLNHPNIAAIYGLEESNSAQALVLELVDGPTLADRIAQGPMSISDALTIGRQIAEALEAAHEKDIIHRDVKPANIKIANDGTVKVLDFGLAKVWDGAPQAGPSGSPRLTTTDFAERTIMGTPAYMSPEQARCSPLDRRTDIWSFGCVLYEMLTGRAPFAGETISDTLAAILDSAPDWSALHQTVPLPVRTLLRRCLEKDRKRRLAHIADARLEIDDALSAPHADAAVSASTSRTREWLIWASAVVLVGLAGVRGMGHPLASRSRRKRLARC